ncbi:A1pp-domain-containing protein [Gonapodya prolifera JEL478]|uniref:A1pp-domain-containing protein n=1 Tax=Gonapodya prolifera (strain JEL478) TaxID=1344416 RepID=A0A139ARY8_GONPJ|nr:A1pp-domain-containing protein [Gonapodya prolifera JEL478]|eukprot:KXS19479.1 A1pp-domain-containing protein [Gonapodya prolifera JEL478]
MKRRAETPRSPSNASTSSRGFSSPTYSPRSPNSRSSPSPSPGPHGQGDAAGQNRRWPRIATLADEFERGSLPEEEREAGRKDVGAFEEDEVSYSQELNKRISLWRGDITTLDVGAIVNAANSSLLGGGGVDGAIHRAAGPGLRKECAKLNGCETGDAKVTGAHRLPSRFVIHTVGPIGQGSERLRSCYATSLRRAKEAGARSVAFPCISTGIYGFPNEPAAHIALQTAREWIEGEGMDEIDRIIFCVFLQVDWEIYRRLAPLYFPPPPAEAASPGAEPDGAGDEADGVNEGDAEGAKGKGRVAVAAVDVEATLAVEEGYDEPEEHEQQATLVGEVVGAGTGDGDGKVR